MRTLFVNNIHKRCGVYQYGLRLANCLPMCVHKEVSGEEDFLKAVVEIQPEKIIYNYHYITMGWLNRSNISIGREFCRRRSGHTLKNVGILHLDGWDISEELRSSFDEILDIDPLKTNGIPRPLFYEIPTTIKNPNHESFITYNRGPDVPIFGSFGFAFKQKGFDKIIRSVNEQYDDAIIKLIMPMAHYCGGGGGLNEVVAKCFSIERKPGIELIISNDFFENEDLLYFLNSNTMNLFLYDSEKGRGVSSVLDYALSVDVPIGISNSDMFRNIYDDSICVYKNKLSDIMKISISKKFREIYTKQSIIDLLIGKEALTSNL